MTEFTPGPWLFREVPEDMHPVEFWVDGPNAVPIADIKVNGHTKANARLIAAAPDLLAALEEAELELAYDGCHTALDSVRAAIAKTRGE